MKKLLLLLGLVASGVAVLGQGFYLVGSASVPVPVSGMKMTNLVFPAAVVTAVKVSPYVLIQRPRGVENVIELKALRRNFPPTNLSVYGKDGRPYSFELHFVDDTSVLTFRVVPDGVAASGQVPAWPGADRSLLLTGLPVDAVTLDSDAAALSERRAFLHGSVSAGGLRLRLRGVYLRDSLLWLCMELRNGVTIPFVSSYLRLYVENKKRVKRMASQQVTLATVVAPGSLRVPGDSILRVALGLEPLVLAKGKRLVVEVADATGGRVLVLGLKGKVLLRARRD
jgi:Domain of unknown function (DUF4138)